MTPYLFGILKMDRPAWIKYLLAKGIPWATYEISELISGTSLSLVDSIKRPLIDFNILGNSVQNTTPSYPQAINSVGDNVNLLQNSGTSTTNNDVEFTVNSDGTVIATGTAAPNNALLSIALNKTFPAGIYTLKDCIGYVESDNYTGWFDGTSNNGATKEFTSNFKFTNIYVRVLAGTTVTNKKFYPKLEQGSQATGYSPYNMGSIQIEKCNKNLLDLAFYENSSSYYTVSENGDIVITANDSRSYSSISDNICLKLKAGSYTFISPSNFERCIVQNKSASGSTLIDARAIKYANFTLVSDSIVFIKLLSTSNNFPVTVEKPMLVYGTITEYPSPYVAHASQTYPIYTQAPMRSIGDVRDDFAKIGGIWYERHKIGHIASYDGETITTAYMSTTGELSTGAEVIYVLAEPTLTECTEKQVEQLEAITNSDTYNGGTNIYSGDIVSPYLETKYWKVR